MMREGIVLHQVRGGGTYCSPGLDEVLDALAAPIVVVDQAGLVNAANQAWLAWVGLAQQPLRAWAGHALAAIDPGGDGDTLDHHLSAVLAGGETVTFVRHLPDDTIPRWQCRIAPIIDPDSEMPAGATITHTALTDGQSMAEQDRTACQSKSRFLADLSHEMRTPLNAIIGFADLMRDQALGPLENPRYRAYAGDIAGCGRHLLNLVNQVLDLARVESGTLDLTEETIDLAQVTRQACDFLGDLIGRSGATLRQIPPPHPVVVRADRRLILQILLNLLANAQKVIPKGGIITLATGLDDSGAPWLRVTDDGPGIPPEQVARVMAPSTTTWQGPHGPSGGGAGLGLGLCRRFAERHGGQLSFDAVAGHGTSITVTLPISRLVD